MLVPNGTMVMVLDGAKISLYRSHSDPAAPTFSLVDHQHEFSPSTAELGSDRPGRRFESAGVGGGAYETTDYHQKAEDHFAIEAAERLNGLAAQGDGKMILIAAPHVLGIMRKHIGDKARHLLIAEINKDYAGRPVADIVELLAHHQG